MAQREERDQLARQAMQAEIDLVHGLRQRLCPQQETAATEANALAGELQEVSALDYSAYIR